MCSWETQSAGRDACDNPRTRRIPSRGTGLSQGPAPSGLGSQQRVLGGTLPCFPGPLLLSKKTLCRALRAPPRGRPSSWDALQFSKKFNAC